ncbi:fibronectin type III domain-containing protein [Cohnella sp. GCM10012308]|uniref:fibronectin type III domain-containing protein n=1 Tax=Cohnella sp. GCM10012308 TaxID=3317329 RepID=UPI003620B8FA
MPGAPTIVAAVGGDRQAIVHFTPPTDDGGSAITGYKVASTDGSFTATGDSSPIAVTGLTNGTPYAFVVQAINAAGTSAASQASSVVVPRVPDVQVTPTIGAVTSSGFTIRLNPAIQNLDALSFVLKDSSAANVPVDMVTADTDGTYRVWAQLGEGQTYKVTLAEEGYAFAADAAVTVPATDKSEIPASVTWVAHYGFLLTFGSQVDHLFAREIVLKDGQGNRVVIPSVTEKVAGSSYLVSVPLSGQQRYSFQIAWADNKVAAGGFDMTHTIAVAATVKSVQNTGFTVKLNVALPGLTAGDFALADDQGAAITLTSATTADQGASYQIEASLSSSRIYTLGMTSAGYDFGTIPTFRIANVTISPWGQDDVFAGFNPSVGSALTHSNFSVTDAAGNLVTFTVSWYAPQQFYLLHFAREAAQSYYVRILIPGYDFGDPKIIRPTSFNYIEAASSSGFRLTLNPAMNYASSDFVLKNSADQTVPIGSVTKNGNGASYDFTASLSPGAYTLSLQSNPSTELPLVWIPLETRLTATAASNNVFTVRLGIAVDGIETNGFRLKDANNNYYYPESVSTEDHGQSYRVVMGGAGLAAGGYTLTLSGSLPSGTPYQSDAQATLVVPETADVTGAVITDVSTGGFTVTFNHPVPGLQPSDLSLADSTGAAVPNFALATEDGGLSYLVTATLIRDKTYKAVFAKSFFAFDASNSFYVNKSASVRVGNVTPNGFTLYLTPALPDLSAARVVITDAQHQELYEALTTSDGGASYRADFGNLNLLGWGKTYDVAVNQPGYTTASIRITTPVIVSVASKSAAQLTLNFNVAVPGLTKANFKLVDDAGAVVPISAAETADDGLSYTVKASMPEGKLYWVTYLPNEDYQLYDPLRITVVKNVGATVSSPSLYGFTLTFSEPVPGLRAMDFTLKNSQGVRLPTGQYTISTADQGKTYRIAYQLAFADTYTVTLSSDEYGTYQDKYALASPVSFDIPKPGVVQLLSKNNTSILLSIDHELELTAANFILKDGDGELVSFTVNQVSAGIFTLNADLSQPVAYTLQIVYPGYDFGPAITISDAILVETLLTNQSQKGFTLNFSPAIPGLAAADIAIEDADGHLVGATAASTADFGKSYRILAPLTGGTTYTVTVTKANYNPEKAGFTLIANGASIDNLSLQGFRLNLLKKHVFGHVEVRVLDASGERQTIRSLYSTDQGFSYEVGIALTPNETYTVQVENVDINNATPGNDYGADLAIQVVHVDASYGGVVPGSNGSKVKVAFDPAMPGLDERSFHLVAGPKELPILDAVTEDGGQTYELTALFAQGNVYSLSIVKDGYDFGATLTAEVPVGVIQSLSNVAAKEIRIAFGPAVADLTADSFTIKDDLGNDWTADSALTSDGGATYAISADFAGGRTYALTAGKPGYDFGTPVSAFIPSQIATTISDAGTNGLTVSFSPAVAGLTAQDFSLISGGVSTPAASATTVDGGASYRLSAALTGGQSYALTTQRSGYAFTPTDFHVDIPVLASVSGMTKTGFTLKLDTAVAGLNATDLQLRDRQYQPVAVSSMTTADQGLTYTVRASLTESETYSLTVSKNGYGFGAGLSFQVPIPVAANLDYVSEQGLTIHLGTPVAGIAASDLNLSDSDGTPVAIAAVTTADDGASYRVTAALKSGSDYKLELLKAGYNFGAALTASVQETIAVRLASTGESTFRFDLSRPVPHLNGAYVKLTDADGRAYTFGSGNDLYDLSGAIFTGSSFELKFRLETGASYTLAIADPNHPFGAPIEVIKPYAVAAAVSQPVRGGFSLTLGSTQVELAAADIGLYTPEGDAVTGVTLTAGDQAGTYKVIGDIVEGMDYTLKLRKKGYDFGADIAFHVPVKVAATVSNPDTNGFTVKLDPGVKDAKFSLTRGGQTLAVQSATTTDGGYTYQIKANVGVNTEYLLVVSKDGYDFGTQLTVNNAAVEPALLNAVTDEIGNKIVLSFDRPISTVPTSAQFSVKYNNSWLSGIGKSLGSDPTQIILQLDPYTLISPSDKVYVTFSGKNTVKAVNGTYLAAFSDAIVLVGTTALGYATTQARSDGAPTARKLKDGFKLSAQEAADIMRVAGFQTNNYAQAIAGVYGLNASQMAQLFRNMQADGLTALAGLLPAGYSLISADIFKTLVAAGYEAPIFVPALRSAGFQSDRIASLLKEAGQTDREIAGILYANLTDPAAKTVSTLRKLGTSTADIVRLLGEVYGLAPSAAYKTLKDAGIGIADAAAALSAGQAGSPGASAAVKLLYGAGYTPTEIGSVIAAPYGIDNAASLVNVLIAAGLSEEQVYAAASRAFAGKDAAAGMLRAGIPFGQVLSAVKAAGASDGAAVIAYAFKQTNLGVSELAAAMRAGGYAVDQTASAVLAAGYGLGELAVVFKQAYELDIPAAYGLLQDRFRYAFASTNSGAGAQSTIFKAMTDAGYDPAQLAKYYLDRVYSRNIPYVLREMKAAVIGTDQALRAIHDIAKSDGYPLTIDGAFQSFGGGYYTSDEVLSAVLYAFAGDTDVTLDVQTVGLAFYKIRLSGWSTGFYDRAMQLRSRMGMTMQQWMELEKSDGRVSGPGVPSTWGIIRDTLLLYGSSTATIQDVANAMSVSSQFTLSELIQGLDDYFGSANVKGIIGILKNTGIPMQTILAAIESNPRYGSGWIDRFKQYGLTASDVTVYYKNKGLTNAEIVGKLSPYTMNEIVLVLRVDMGLTADQALTLLTASHDVQAVSQAIGYIYREAEITVAAKLLKLQGFNASEVATYLNNHGVNDPGNLASNLAAAGFSKSEVTEVVLQRNSGVTQLPAAIAALKSVFGQQEVGLADILAGAAANTPEEALSFMSTHHYELLQMAVALKTVYGKTSGEATSILNAYFVGKSNYTLGDVLNKVTLAYSSTEESTILDVLSAQGVTSPKAAIVKLRQLGYDKANGAVNLAVVARVLKNGYGQDAAQASALLFEDAAYNAVQISYGVNEAYHANDEIGNAAKLLVGAGITDARSAVRYLADRSAGMALTARVLNEIYHADMQAALTYMSAISNYRQQDILVALQTAYGSDPLSSYLALMKQRGANAYEITNELEKQGRVFSAEGRSFLIDTLKSLGYDKESIMYEILTRYKPYSTEADIAQNFVRAGFSDAASMAAMMLKTRYNPNEGATPVRVLTLALPNATHGSIAQEMKKAGFTAEAIVSGMLAFGFDDSVAALLGSFGFSAKRASEILHSARYSTEGKVVWLKKLGYPLEDYFGTLGNGSTDLVVILKKQGFSAVQIAQSLYRANTEPFRMIQYLDEGGFSDLPTLVDAYYQSGEPMMWTIHDIYIYGTSYGAGTNHRWPLIDVVRELQKHESVSMVALAGLINYANGNKYGETFTIVKALSAAEQASLRSSLGIAAEVVGEHVPNIAGLSIMRAIGLSANQAAIILKNEGGVSDWKFATLILFMSGYGVTDVINAVFDAYRTEIGIQVLIALFSSGAGQLIKDWDKYKFVIEKIVTIISKNVKN